jgi:hypothetical protein
VTITPKTLQNKLIELESFIIQAGNEKNSLMQKYTKLVNIQSKLTESFDSPSAHIETVKKLNERLYDISEENKQLRERLDEINGHGNHNDDMLLKTDKENIFTNNYIKENPNSYKTLMDNNADTSYNNILELNFKTLEQRVMELERGLKRGKTKDASFDEQNNFIPNEHEGREGLPYKYRNKSAQHVVPSSNKKPKVIKKVVNIFNFRKIYQQLINLKQKRSKENLAQPLYKEK